MLFIFNFCFSSFVSGQIAKSSWYVVLWNGRSAVRIPGETGKTSLIRVNVGLVAFVIGTLALWSTVLLFF